jgi:hypothetical protein
MGLWGSMGTNGATSLRLSMEEFISSKIRFATLLGSRARRKDLPVTCIAAPLWMASPGEKTPLSGRLR